jgi:signal transduction histidine kinase
MLVKTIISWLFSLVEPRSSKNEDYRRREFILNIILLGSLLLSGFVFLDVLYRLFVQQGGEYKGNSPIFIFTIFVVFLVLYVFSRKGFAIQASFVLIGIYLVPTTYALYLWGADLPQALLTYALIIVISGILIGTWFAYFITFVISCFLLGLTFFQVNLIVLPKLYWRDETLQLNDSFVAIVTLSIIAIVSWLSNREIEKSLRRARRSEADLKKERDSLEVKVEERTRELKQAQMEKMSQLAHFAEFGKLSSGLLHDLANPLTALSLNLGRLKDVYAQEVSGMKLHVNQALEAAKRMEDFVKAARKQIQQQETMVNFSPAEEILQVIQILEYRAKSEGVQVNFKGDIRVVTYGNFLKFSQVMANLISNAIDAYAGESYRDRSKEVEIRLKRENDTLFITVRDFGMGIAEENLGRIFDPFFTTKTFEKGTGIGLSISKEIIEKDFGGHISVASAAGRWTLFTVEIPIVVKEDGSRKKSEE